MTPTQTATGRQRRVYLPRPADSASSPQHPDPPIYTELMRIWADRGRTLPGRHDPEWAALAAPIVRRGQFSDSPAPPGDER
ncbi:hypothetical protein ACWEIK_18555 [Streptomyces sp. NPDC004673]|uniref:hypothetical protein n=1 Tax=unclassified Streptomyces TaxID=2593676 RepID=UPI003722CD20